MQKLPGPLAVTIAIFVIWTVVNALVLTLLQQSNPKLTGGHPVFAIVYFGGFVLVALYFSNTFVRTRVNALLSRVGLRSDRQS